MNALIADLQTCVKGATADAGSVCNTTDIEKQATILASVGPAIQKSACPAVTTLNSLTATKTVQLKTDAVSDFTTTCAYANDLVSIETQVLSLLSSAADGGVSDAGAGSGAYYNQLKAILTLAQDAYTLQGQLPALNSKVQTDLDAKPCG